MKTPEHKLLGIAACEWFTRAGYRRISNKYRTVSRIDREDWREQIKLKYGVVVSAENEINWADMYRCTLSSDTLRLNSDCTFKIIPHSRARCTEYVDLPVPTALAKMMVKKIR